MGTALGWRLSFIPYYMTATTKWKSPPVDEAIRVLKKAGYDGVEWMLGQHFNDEGDLRALVGRTRAKGLTVSNIMCWQDLVTKDRSVRNERVRRSRACSWLQGTLTSP